MSSTLALGLVVTVIDNFIKPLLIGVGVAMPMSLTILGVFGGFVGFERRHHGAEKDPECPPELGRAPRGDR